MRRLADCPNGEPARLFGLPKTGTDSTSTSGSGERVPTAKPAHTPSQKTNQPDIGRESKCGYVKLKAFREPAVARKCKHLKGRKCHYTFRIGAVFDTAKAEVGLAIEAGAGIGVGKQVDRLVPRAAEDISLALLAMVPAPLLDVARRRLSIRMIYFDKGKTKTQLMPWL